jgi:ActR/RegA family two-component response regulator
MMWKMTENIQEGDKIILIIEDDTNFAKALLKYAHLQNYKGVVVVRGDYALSAAQISSACNFTGCSASCKRWLGGNG